MCVHFLGPVVFGPRLLITTYDPQNKVDIPYVDIYACTISRYFYSENT